MNQPLDFQSIILSLQHFWAEQGCLVWQPYYTQVGAGTMNPGTFLRVLGPEPWNVVYVEPAIRPDDARYGENPNRMQMHYQLQVILKPDPGNPQELYLRSLESIGIDPRQHDIRFVEDKWEAPALGAWGLGWEVWLDGQEITQFTYFQQAGGQLCDPVSVEITYGLDRIAIALQRVHGFQEIRWNSPPGAVLTAGDVNLQAEQEHSRYYFEVASVERLRQMFNLYEAEAAACLEQNLVLPAHDYVLKSSHTFNVLDARGAIGVTERQAYFGRMRELARRVAEAYLEQRAHLEYPWLKDEGVVAKSVADQSVTTLIPGPAAPAPFLLEIGTEELPVGDLDAALEQLQERLPAWLDELRLSHGEMRVLGTPRRLVVHVEDLAPRSADRQQVVKGPPAARAFDALGEPTPAAEGFARSKGLAVADLEVREMDGGRYAVAVVRQAGRPTPQVLAEALPHLVASLRFDKAIRWNRTNVTFSRPIRWFLALLGEQVVPFEYAGLRSGNVTRGLRFTQPEEICIRDPAHYFREMAAQGILLDVVERRQVITAQVAEVAAQVKGGTPDDPSLLAEVANLVEVPNALLGAFDPSHLRLPEEVLISVMKVHQRYFPVMRDGELLPYFITIRNGGTVSNGDGRSAELVREGNEHVIRARFADADFFVRDDLKRPLQDFLPRLGTLTFQLQLGSMLDKTRRIVGLVESLAPQLGLDAQEGAAARRAAELCKADLVTKMVVEMTSLQGVIGRIYALRSGESQAVADAIYEHYLPRFSGDALPASLPGLVVGLADRLDTLAGLFVAGLAPTGAKDPFALRRAALGLVQALIANDLDFDLRPALQSAARQLPPALVSKSSEAAERLEACRDFIVERLRYHLLEGGAPYDVVDAVVSAQGFNPAHSARAVQELVRWVRRPDWRSILPAYARCVRITRDQAQRFPVEPQAFLEPAENALYAALTAAEASPRPPGAVDGFLNAFLPMIPAVNRFFDDVLVMTEEASTRENRLGLLQRISALAEGVADMSKLEGF
jgi:glycyl-tRNA synthetase